MTEYRGLTQSIVTLGGGNYNLTFRVHKTDGPGNEVADTDEPGPRVYKAGIIEQFAVVFSRRDPFGQAIRELMTPPEPPPKRRIGFGVEERRAGYSAGRGR